MGNLFEKFFKGPSKAFEDANKDTLDDYYIEKARKKREAEERRQREREERFRMEQEEYDRKIREALDLANRGKKQKSWFDSEEEDDNDKGGGGGWFSGW